MYVQVEHDASEADDSLLDDASSGEAQLDERKRTRQSTEHSKEEHSTPVASLTRRSRLLYFICAVLSCILSLWIVRLALHASIASPPPLSLSAVYVRCDLTPLIINDPSLNGVCHSYQSGADDATQQLDWQHEGDLTQAGVDSAYFSLYDIRHTIHTPPVLNSTATAIQSLLSGRLIAIHENCAPSAWSAEMPPNSTAHRMATFLERRFGPTWLEMRMQGPELIVQAFQYVEPSQYSEYHRAVLDAGSVRVGAMSSRPPYQRYSTAQDVILDVIQRQKLVPAPSVERRTYGGSVCLYETTYTVTLPGYYNISVYLEMIDYEHLSNEGRRRGWKRAQFARMWELRNMHVVDYPHAITVQPQPVAPVAQSSLALSQSKYQLPAFNARVRGEDKVRVVPEFVLVPLEGDGVLPLLPRTHRLGRWVHTTEPTTTRRPVWWKRAALLSKYDAPEAGHCRVARLNDYAFMPYCYSQDDGSTSAQLCQSDGSGIAIDWLPSSYHRTVTPHPFSFAHADCCLSGRRLAFLGDSQTRTLISRFASVSMAQTSSSLSRSSRNLAPLTPPQPLHKCGSV